MTSMYINRAKNQIYLTLQSEVTGTRSVCRSTDHNESL